MGFAPGSIDPRASSWHLLGTALRHWRHEVRHLSLAAVAKAAWIDPSNLSKWERGERLAPLDAIERIDSTLGANGFLIALRDVVATYDHMAVVSGESGAGDAEVMDLVRRQLLSGLISLRTTAPISGILEGLDGLRNLVDAGSSRLDEWEEVAWEYAHDVGRPRCGRSSVLGDLARDLLTVQRLMRAAPATEVSEWARVSARMTFLLAYELGSVGHFGESRQWWSSARRAAEHAGDTGLLAAVHATEAVQALYEGRPLSVVVARVDGAIAAVKGAPCLGTVRAHGARAHALAVAGDHEGASAALEEQSRTFDALPSDVTTDTATIYGWPGERVLHSRSLALTLIGHRQAEAAQREAMSAYGARQGRQSVQVKLHGAISVVRSGDVAAGLDHAREALSVLSTDEQTSYVRHMAATVLDSVPISERSRPAALEYGEYLTRTANTGG